MFYVDDIADSLNAKVRLFANDTIAYLAIVTDEDARSLQNDPTKLGESEQKWHMEFHPDKCQVLTISRKRNPVRYEYVLHGHKLQHVDSAKYLGVTMTSDFSWNKHADNVVNKAKGTLGFLRRNLQISISFPSLKTTAYTSLVRPVLEYASTVWDPYTPNLA